MKAVLAKASSHVKQDLEASAVFLHDRCLAGRVLVRLHLPRGRQVAPHFPILFSSNCIGMPSVTMTKCLTFSLVLFC